MRSLYFLVPFNSADYDSIRHNEKSDGHQRRGVFMLMLLVTFFSFNGKSVAAITKPISNDIFHWSMNHNYVSNFLEFIPHFSLKSKI